MQILKPRGLGWSLSPHSFVEKELRHKLPHGFNDVSPVRRRIMASIRGKHSRTTEQVLRMGLIRCGIRGWKLHAAGLPGCPDIFFPAQKLAVFVDGCFWHACPKCSSLPKIRSDFWKLKLEKNRKRDRKNTRLLRNLGFSVIRVWEHTLKTPQGQRRVIQKMQNRLMQVRSW